MTSQVLVWSTDPKPLIAKPILPALTAVNNPCLISRKVSNSDHY